MRRFLLGLISGALIFGAAFAGAKLVTVTNPMTQSLDGGGQSIYNLSQVVASSELRVAQAGAISGLVTFQAGSGLDSASIFAGSVDPNAGDGQACPPGCLYLEFGATPGIFFKAGPLNTDWQRLAGTP
jgi:hypothetical protein